MHVYILKCKNTEKRYVGVTIRNVEKRLIEHLRCRHDVPLARAIQKYGKESIVIEKVFDFSKLPDMKSLFDLEKHFIGLYNTYNDGYNATLGGESGPFQGKRIKQYDKNTLELIEIYDSSAEAERQTGIRNRNIAKCYLGERLTAGGYIWTFFEDYPEPIKYKYNEDGKFKKVVMKDLDGNFLEEFESAKEAEEKIGANRKAISNCCLGKCKTTYGFIWCFKE